MKNFINYWKALTFAVEKYSGLTRKNKKTPYVVHPLRVVSILRSAGYSEFEDEDLMISALLHDVIEEKSFSKNIIKEKFNEKIAIIISELSIKPQQEKDKYLKSLNNVSKEAKIIKMADRIDNLLEMNETNWSNKKKVKYAEDGKIILEGCGNANKELSLKLKHVINTILSRLKS